MFFMQYTMCKFILLRSISFWLSTEKIRERDDVPVIAGDGWALCPFGNKSALMTDRLLRGLHLDIMILELILEIEVFLSQGLDLL